MKSRDRNRAAQVSSEKEETADKDLPDIVALFLKLPAENIVVLRFLLESYEGFGELRTLNRDRGEVVILAAPDTELELRAALESATHLTQHREIPPPSSLAEDWLLN